MTLRHCLPALTSTCGLMALAVFGGPLHAQSIAEERQFVTPWFEDGAATVTKLLSGRFVGDEIADAAVLRTLDGGGLHVARIVEPARFATVLPSVEAHDMAVLKSATASGRDALAVLGPEGLSVLVLSSNGRFEPVDMLGDSWAGATRLWCIEGGSGQSEILGWHPQSAMLLRANWSTSTQSLSWLGALTPELPFVDEVIDLDFGGSGGGREIALVMGEWLSIRNWDGSLFGVPQWIGPDNSPAPGKRMFTALERASGPDALAFHMWSPAHGAFIVGAFNASSAWPSLVMDSAYRGVSLTVSNYDGDGYEDLVLLDATSGDARVARGSASSGLVFDSGFGSVVELSGAACGVNDYSHISAADFDADGDEDLLAMVADGGQRVMVFNALASRVTATLERVPGSRSEVFSVNSQTWSTSLTLAAQVPPTAFDALSPATHLEVVGWFLPNAGQDPLTMQANGSVLAYVPLTPSSSVTNLTLPVSWVSHPLNIDQAALFLSARLVRDVGGARARTWPAATYFYSYSHVNTLALMFHLQREEDTCDGPPVGGGISEGTVGGSTGGGSGGSAPSPTGRP